jgi:chromosome segregation ATPase
VIQSLLLFGFGFLCAVLVALLVAPAFWRRAVRLTERRIRATVPLTMNEIQAEKDGLRAEFAMSARRLEMKAKDLQDRVAGQMIEIERSREELRQLAEERDNLKAEHAALDRKNGELEAALKAAGEDSEALSAKFEAIGAQLADKDTEISRLDLAATDASLEVSNRQIELAAREAEVAKLLDDVARLKEQRRVAEQKLRDMTLDNKSGREALKTERARSTDLERRLEKALATIADRDEALARGERERARLSERESGSTASGGAPEVGAPEAGVPEAGAPEAKDTAEASSAEPDAEQEALARLKADRKRLEERLTTLTRENKRLRTASLSPQAPTPVHEPAPGETALREKISNLAAEMVALTALIEGPGSPIDKALAMPEAEHAAGDAPSLAERVRALREAAAQRG